MRNRRSLRYHGLSRPKLRQSWNKYNLWNLKSFRLPRMMRRTFFQQKWSAKAMTRAYHGEHIKERQWERMFSRRLNTVVDMNPRYMAEHDGSEQASGRGSGRQPAPLPPNTRPSFEDEYQRSPSNKTKRGDTPTPYMQMTFAPLERRLDTAVFRAMFASSSRQARQFVVHGGVTVNGQTVNRPGYLLNPGDMFQVEVDRVLTATGRLKEPRLIASVQRKKAAYRAERLNAPSPKRDSSSLEETDASPSKTTPADEAAPAKEAASPKEAAPASEAVSTTDPKPTEQTRASKKTSIKRLRKNIQLLLSEADEVSEANKALLLRMAGSVPADSSAPATDPLSPLGVHVSKFLKPPKIPAGPADAALAKLYRLEPEEREQFQERLAEARAELDAMAPEEQQRYRSAQTPEDREAARRRQEAKEARQREWLEAREARARKIAALPPDRRDEIARQAEQRRERRRRRKQLFPHDPTKPYLTPWRPRPFIGPFAFIPRYLEVNQRICAAVYLRHPVARPGMSEVPTPFPSSIGQLAYNWYLRRG